MAVPDYSYHRAATGAGEDKRPLVSCSLACLKFSLYCYNILLLVFGLAGLSVALWTLIDRGQFLALVLASSGVYRVSGGALLATSCAVLGLTLLGCCGISRESRAMVLVYGWLLAAMVLVQCATAVTAYLYRDQVHRQLVASLNVSMLSEYGAARHNLTTAAVDDLQTTFKCCGAESFEDWRLASWWSSEGRHSNKVPDSCCKSVSAGCGARDHPSNVHYTGCAHQLAALAAAHLLLTAAIAAVICLVHTLGAAIAFKLASSLRTAGD